MDATPLFVGIAAVVTAAGSAVSLILGALLGALCNYWLARRKQTADTQLSVDAQALAVHKAINESLTARVTVLEARADAGHARELACLEKQADLLVKNTALETRCAANETELKTLREEMATLRAALAPTVISHTP